MLRRRLEFQMITSHFELRDSTPIAQTLQQLEKSGIVQWLVATKEYWEVGIVFPDYQAASELFGGFKKKNADFDIIWMVKDQNPFKENSRYYQLSMERLNILKQMESTS